METSRLIDFDEIDINQHEHMKNALYNLNNRHYLSYNHKSKMIIEYNNPSLISCMLHSLFPFGIGVPKMVIRPIKVSLQLHTKHLMNLNKTQYKISKHCLFPFFVFNIIR
jgi:hypothetical protein